MSEVCQRLGQRLGRWQKDNRQDVSVEMPAKSFLVHECYTARTAALRQPQFRHWSMYSSWRAERSWAGLLCKDESEHESVRPLSRESSRSYDLISDQSRAILAST
jgi:hypothetical protein